MENIKRIVPNTRMNQLSIHIPLNQRFFNPKKPKKPLCIIILKLGSMKLETIQKLIKFLNMELFSDYEFAVFRESNQTERVEIPISGRFELVGFTPPITISSMTRGCIENSVTCYNLKISFQIFISDVQKILNFIESNVSHDLAFLFKRLSDPKKKPKKEVAKQ